MSSTVSACCSLPAHPLNWALIGCDGVGRLSISHCCVWYFQPCVSCNRSFRLQFKLYSHSVDELYLSHSIGGIFHSSCGLETYLWTHLSVFLQLMIWVGLKKMTDLLGKFSKNNLLIDHIFMREQTARRQSGLLLRLRIYNEGSKCWPFNTGAGTMCSYSKISRILNKFFMRKFAHKKRLKHSHSPKNTNNIRTMMNWPCSQLDEFIRKRETDRLFANCANIFLFNWRTELPGQN